MIDIQGYNLDNILLAGRSMSKLGEEILAERPYKYSRKLSKLLSYPDISKVYGIDNSYYTKHSV